MFNVLGAIFGSHAMALQSGVSALRGYDLAQQQRRSAEDAYNAYNQISRDFERAAYLPYKSIQPARMPFKCDYCATLFDLDHSCGCGANRCEAATAVPFIIAEGQR